MVRPGLSIALIHSHWVELIGYGYSLILIRLGQATAVLQISVLDLRQDDVLSVS